MKKSINYIVILLLIMLAFPSMAKEKTAVLQWYKRINLSTPVSGVVKKVFVTIGDNVIKGQNLVKIDDRVFHAHVKQAKAVLIRAKETHDEARRESDRAQQLFDRNSISVRDQQLVKIEYTKAFAHLQEAEALVTRALLDIEYSMLKSPIDGLVVYKSIEVGETINNSIHANTMMAIAGNKDMIARAWVKIDEMKGLQVGARLDIKVQGVIFSGVVLLLGQEADPKASEPQYQLDVLFKNSVNLRQGQAATILLP